MHKPSATSIARFQHTTAPVAMVLGIIGAVLCLILIAGVWVGRSWAADRVDRMESSVNAVLGLGIQASTTAAQRLDALASQMTDISNEAAAVAADPNAGDSAFNDVRVKLMDLGTRYDDFKAGYLALHERVTGALDALDGVAQLVPTVSDLQTRLSDAVTQLDTRVQQLDASITDLRQRISDVTALPATIKSVAFGQIATLISGAADFTRTVTTRLQTAQTNVQQTASDVDSAVFWIAIAGSLVLLWVFVLNVALWALGRRLRTSTPALQASAAPSA